MTALPYTTVARAFRATAATFPEHDFLEVLPETAIAYGIAAGTWTYARALQAVDRLVALYAAAGYGHGHRAGLLLLNRPEFLLHFLALNTLGVSAVPINADFRAVELEYLIAHSEIALVVALPSHRQALVAAAQAAGFISLRLGPRILRTETAAMALLATLQGRWGDFVETGPTQPL